MTEVGESLGRAGFPRVRADAGDPHDGPDETFTGGLERDVEREGFDPRLGLYTADLAFFVGLEKGPSQLRVGLGGQGLA